MKELWDQALLSYNLPFTLALGLVMVYWILSTLGAVDMDSLDVNLETETDLDLEGSSNSGGFFDGIMRFVNAQDVPVMLILSLLLVFMWVFSISLNYYFNPSQSELMALGLLVGNFIVSILLIKAVTQPLRPFFRSLKTDKEHQEPLIGSAGFVKSRTLDEAFGQCEINRPKGAPALLNCRLASGEEPLKRGDQVLVIGFDDKSDKFLIKPLNSQN